MSSAAKCYLWKWCEIKIDDDKWKCFFFLLNTALVQFFFLFDFFHFFAFLIGFSLFFCIFSLTFLVYLIIPSPMIIIQFYSISLSCLAYYTPNCSVCFTVFSFLLWETSSFVTYSNPWMIFKLFSSSWMTVNQHTKDLWDLADNYLHVFHTYLNKVVCSLLSHQSFLSSASYALL